MKPTPLRSIRTTPLAPLIPVAMALTAWTAEASSPSGQIAASLFRMQQQTPTVMAPAGALRRLDAARVDDQRSIKIDGQLDDAAWQRAQFLNGFTQREPREGEPATERTEFAIVYDEAALYVGARMRSTNPGAIRALVTRRDREGSSEQLIVSFDTYRDRRTAYTFAVTAAGVRIDYYHSSDFETARDYAFDPVWEARTAIDSTGWTAELRIPFSQLRFNASNEHVWGVNVVRVVPDKNERSYWVLVRRDDTGWSSRMGELAGIRGVRPSRRVEFLPYVATDTRFYGTVDPANPFAARREGDVRVGGDVKMGLGPNATLEATINPDFGQVEADPAEVNLTAFETFFPERRPFFTEGTQLFNSRNNFYSRRIGAPPPLPAGGDYADVPSNSTILGATKLTARFPSKLSVGTLLAVTDREEARTFNSTTGAFSSAMVAPRTFYGVGVAQQEFGRDASVASIMLTGVERDIDPGSPAASVLARRAYTGIADGRIRWSGGEYDMSAFAGFSYVEGDSLAIRAQQTSSRRYYQRPDADYVEVDPSATKLTGYVLGINHSKLGGAHWRWDIDLGAESPAYELNDIGRLGGSDDIDAFAQIRYRESKRGRFFHNYQVGVSGGRSWNFGRIRQGGFTEMYGDFTLLNFWSGYFGVGRNPRALSDNLTRGGPLMGTSENRYWWAGLNGRPGARTGWSVSMDRNVNENGGRSTNADLSISFRPGSQWEFSVVPSYNTGVTARQYVSARAGGTSATFGRRYIFAYVDRDEFSTRFRLNYAVSPNLTLETYAEPFASSGKYYDYGELPAARSRDLRRYGTDGTTISEPDAAGNRVVTDGTDTFTLGNHDFNVLSFRSNAVLRWEWRPGSTLFVVWQQDRSSFTPSGDAVRPGRMWDALNAEGSQFLALKVSYWLPIR